MRPKCFREREMRAAVAKPPSARSSSFTSVRSRRGRRERKTYYRAPSLDDGEDAFFKLDDDDDDDDGVFRFGNASSSSFSSFSKSPMRRRRCRGTRLRTRASKSLFEKIADEATKMLDVMEGGPKLRKWYGEDSSVGKDGEAMKKREREKKEENEEAFRNDEEKNEAYQASVNGVASTSESSPKRAIYVLDSGSKLGDAVVMQLVLAKLDVKVACENVEAESARYGPYVDVADLGNAEALRRSLAGVRSVIVPAGKFDESFAKSCKESGVKHIVLLSTAKASKGNVLSMLLEDEGTRARKDDKREQLAKSLDIPLTIIRPVNVVDEPTRGKMMTFSKEEGRLSGTISIEDVAVCAVRALAQPPKKGGGVFAFEIATSNETGKTDWKGQFAMLKA